jgi:hypothetical protein
LKAQLAEVEKARQAALSQRKDIARLRSRIIAETFARIALEKWGVGLPEADGSAANPVQWGMSVCEIDIEMMLSNLGDDFSGSFQEYALETFCPELLP